MAQKPRDDHDLGSAWLAQPLLERVADRVRGEVLVLDVDVTRGARDHVEIQRLDFVRRVMRRTVRCGDAIATGTSTIAGSSSAGQRSTPSRSRRPPLACRRYAIARAPCAPARAPRRRRPRPSCRGTAGRVDRPRRAAARRAHAATCPSAGTSSRCRRRTRWHRRSRRASGDANRRAGAYCRTPRGHAGAASIPNRAERRSPPPDRSHRSSGNPSRARGCAGRAGGAQGR